MTVSKLAVLTDRGRNTTADAGTETWLDIDEARHPLMDLLTGMTTELRRALGLGEPLEVMLGVPANANGNQRFLTIEAFRRAGFQVLGLLNEPSAAAIEFGHSQKLKGRLLVYDLGGADEEPGDQGRAILRVSFDLPLGCRLSGRSGSYGA